MSCIRGYHILYGKMRKVEQLHCERKPGLNVVDQYRGPQLLTSCIRFYNFEKFTDCDERLYTLTLLDKIMQNSNTFRETCHYVIQIYQYISGFM